MAAAEQVIQGILQQIETAWNRYDSVSLAAAFAENANFIQIFAGQLDGRAAIETAHRHIFETQHVCILLGKSLDCATADLFEGRTCACYPKVPRFAQEGPCAYPINAV